MWRKASRYSAVVLIAIAVGAAVAAAVGFLRGETHRAEATYVVTSSDEVLLTEEIDPLVQTLISTFESRRVAEEAVAQGGLSLSGDDLQGGLSMSARPRSALLIGTFDSSDPAVAKAGLDAASAAFLNAVGESRLSGAGRRSSEEQGVSVDVFSAPQVLPDPVSLSPWILAAVGGLMGLLAALGIAVVREASRPRLDSLREAEEVFGPRAIDLTGDDASARAARVLRSSIANLDAAPILIAGPDGTSAARRRFIEAAAGGMREFGWKVRLISSETAGPDGRHPATNGDSSATEVNGSSSDDAAARVDVEALALAPPEIIQSVRTDLETIALTEDVILVDLPFLATSLPRGLTSLAQALIVVVPLGVVSSREAASVAEKVSRLESSIVSDVVIVDSRGPLST